MVSATSSLADTRWPKTSQEPNVLQVIHVCYHNTSTSWSSAIIFLFFLVLFYLFLSPMFTYKYAILACVRAFVCKGRRSALCVCHSPSWVSINTSVPFSIRSFMGSVMEMSGPRTRTALNKTQTKRASPCTHNGWLPRNQYCTHMYTEPTIDVNNDRLW